MIKLLLVVAFVSIAGVNKVNAQAGSIDSSFGNNGIRLYTKPPDIKKVLRVLTAPSGESYLIYDAEEVCEGIKIAKYSADGFLDLSFGIDGYTAIFTMLDFGDARLQDDGKIIIGGSNHKICEGEHDRGQDHLMARFTTDGALDTSFNKVGSVRFSLGEIANERVISITTKGNLIAAIGRSDYWGGEYIYYLTVYNLNGTHIFHDILHGPITEIFDNRTHYSVAIDSNEVLLIGYLESGYRPDPSSSVVSHTFIRYNADGSTDTTFRPNAIKALLDGGHEFAGSIDVTPEGKIILMTRTSEDGAIYFLNNDGSINQNFGENGKVIMDLIPQIMILHEGKIIIGGYVGQDFVMLRFNSDGSPDTNFGIGGKVTTNLPSSTSALKFAISGNRLLVNGNNFTAAYLLGGNNLSCPSHTTVYTDKSICATAVNNINPVGNSTVTYTLSGATTGSGNGSASGTTFNKGITLVTYTSSDGALSCSFNVIVADNPVDTTIEIIDSVVYRVNAGGGQITNSIGTFAADQYFSPVPGFTYFSTRDISGTNDDTIYKTERSSTLNNGTFNYVFPVSNAKYKVILHFAEIFHTATGKRLFDVSAEGVKVLDNYDIFKKAGNFAATTESFTVNVTDGNLNLYFSALAIDGGVNRPKVSAIEIIRTNTVPIANAGPSRTIALPAVNSTVLNGSGSDDGTISTYNWTQVSGPNTANLTPGNNVATPTAAGLVAGTYVFSLIVTDDHGINSKPSQVTVNVDSVLYRVNAGGRQITNSIGTFAADQFYSPTPGSAYSTGSPINSTTNDAIYQTERISMVNNGTFNYIFPVSNGKYRVVLHFAEIFHNATGKRVFDVSAEGAKVLDNYDIFQKAGRFTATTESFIVDVADDTLNLDFSSLTADGGVNRPKVSAIEIIGTTPNQKCNNIPVTFTRKGNPTKTAQLEAVNIEGVKVFPNPSRNAYYNLLLPKNVQGEVLYKLFSSLGVQLTQGKLMLPKAGSPIDLNFSTTIRSSGIYYLHLNGKNVKTVTKLIKGN